jgi:CheY-like chemotaxis protein
MPKSGRVTIETRRHRGTELAEWLGESLPHDTYVALVVADTGEGMSEETRSRAFDPFFSTKPPERGSGLGLSLVHAVLNQAGGHVRLRSEPGQGTCCELYWPLASESAEMAHASARGATHAPVARILLVEDEHPIRRALVRVLANTGHTVEEAGDAEEALAILEATDAPFDLLITDVVMPRSSGIDLAELATERWPDLKVVLISGYLNDYSLGDADARFAFLAKPFTPKDLQEKVREVLAGSPGSAGAASTLSADPSAR